MGFKNPNQRKAIFAEDKQKGMGMPVQKSTPSTYSTLQSPQMTMPSQSFKMGAPSAPKFNPPVGNSIKPTSNPKLPALPKSPKFGKLRNYFKKV